MNAPRLVNANGFTDDDEIARELTLDGRPRPYDDIVMDVVKAYREGMSEFRAIHSGYVSPHVAVMLEEALRAIFTTSVVRCELNPSSHREIVISVRFPRPGD